MQRVTCEDGKLRFSGFEKPQGRAERSFVTGLNALDALAPGNAFTRGGVHELLTNPSEGSPLTLALLLALGAAEQATPTAAPANRAVVWCDPQQQIYPPALAARGMPLERLFLLRPGNDRDLAWSIGECLGCKGVAAVVAAPPVLNRVSARRLQLAAERGGSIGILLRHRNAKDASCYAAATRWHVRPAPGERTIQRWTVQLIHGHGGRVGGTVILEFNRENLSLRATELLADRSISKGANRPDRAAVG